MDERVQERDDVLRILPQHALDNLTIALKDSLLFEDAEGVHDVLGKPEGDYLWDFELGTFLKDAVKVYVGNLTCVLMNEYVITVTISQTNHIANHRPNGS